MDDGIIPIWQSPDLSEFTRQPVNEHDETESNLNTNLNNSSIENGSAESGKSGWISKAKTK
jgi:hypothetical protein